MSIKRKGLEGLIGGGIRGRQGRVRNEGRVMLFFSFELTVFLSHFTVILAVIAPDLAVQFPIVPLDLTIFLSHFTVILAVIAPDLAVQLPIVSSQITVL
jgi:uncharacterized membrane protein YwaF